MNFHFWKVFRKGMSPNVLEYVSFDIYLTKTNIIKEKQDHDNNKCK